MNYAYSFTICLSIIVGVLVATRTQKGLGLRWNERASILLGAFIGAMVGSKIPFLFDDVDALMSGAVWFSNGKTILTGLVGGYLGVEAAKWSIGVSTRTGDTFVVPVALSIAIGRIACFVGGCCYGNPTQLPWGVIFSEVDEMPRHPTQLYEAVFHFVAAVIAAWSMKSVRRRSQQVAIVGVAANEGGPSSFRILLQGNRFKLYVIAYAVYRFFSEWMRPEAELVFGLTGYQLACVIIVALFGWLFTRHTPQTFPVSSQAQQDRN